MENMRSIAEMQKKGFGQMYREKVKEAWNNDWYFSGWEKWMIMVCWIWSVYSLGKFVWGLI